MVRILFVLICLALSGTNIAAQSSQKPKDRIWFVWEHRAVNSKLCKTKKYCDPVSTYVQRLAEEPSTEKSRSMIGALDIVAKRKKYPAEHPDAPKICQQTNAQKILGLNAEEWPQSDKLDALQGLKGVYFRLDGLKSPPNYEGQFGPNIQRTVEDKFERAGIPVLTEKEMEQTPGKPHLNIYFSNTNPDTGCWFSVFGSLSQTMLLTRNHTVKLKVGTWSNSAGYSTDDPDRTEFAAIMMVIDKFIADYRKANQKTSPKSKSVRKKKKRKSKG